VKTKSGYFFGFSGLGYTMGYVIGGINEKGDRIIIKK
jgi:hypothetical protein